MKNLYIQISDELHRRLKMLAADRNTSIKEIVTGQLEKIKEAKK